MPFTIDSETLIITGRVGDTASLSFNFKQDLSPYDIHFYVKSKISDPDEKIIINKKIEKPNSTSATINLTTVDTEKLTSRENSYNTYYWGLKIYNGIEFAQTIIPEGTNPIPMMLIYPKVGGIN